MTLPDTSPSVQLLPRRGIDRGAGNRWVLAAAGAAAGIVLAVIWSFEFVDRTIGDNVANAMLGYEARDATIAGATAGLLFAFATGLAGTFTACNIAVFGTLPRMAEADRAGQGRIGPVAALLGWLTAGMVAVSAAYGAFGVVFSGHLPQLSTELVGGIPVRLLQASVVFGLVGLAFAYLGLAGLGLVPDPFAGRVRAQLFTFGVLVGLLLVGRPFPLFRQLFEYAVATGNPLYGALTFVLQSVGNIVLVAILAVLIVAGTRGAASRWLLARPARASAIGGLALLGLGVFMVVYWCLRLPARFGYGWFPTMPWS